MEALGPCPLSSETANLLPGGPIEPLPLPSENLKPGLISGHLLAGQGILGTSSWRGHYLIG